MVSYIIFIPILASLIVAFINCDRYAKILGITASLTSLILSFNIWFQFDVINNLSLQFIEKYSVIDYLKLDYYVGVDGFSLPFVLLTNFLSPIILLSTYNEIKTRVKEYVICILIASSVSTLVFTAQNLLLFYIAFEAALIPMYIIIVLLGGKNKIYSSYKFFLYTFFGSFFMLLSIAFIAQKSVQAGVSLNFADLKLSMANIGANLDVNQINENQKLYLFLGIFFALALKIPMIPFHGWLPDAHVQAPTGGSMMLAGVLLKLGGYGMIKILLNIFPEFVKEFSSFVFILSSAAVVYTSFIAISQQNMKKMIAYSSIAHMGYVTAGIFSGNIYGVSGAIFQMISHGLISSGLFFIIGILYTRTHTKKIGKYSGLAPRMPFLASVFMILTFGSIAVPLTSGFVGEFLSLYGMFLENQLYAIISASGVILSAIYMLNLYKKTMFGEFKLHSGAEEKEIVDFEFSEKIASSLLCLSVIILGVYPNLILQMFNNIKIP